MGLIRAETFSSDYAHNARDELQHFLERNRIGRDQIISVSTAYQASPRWYTILLVFEEP